MTPFPRRFPQAVILDWDNTLVENWEVLLAAMNDALVHFHQPRWNVAQMIESSKQSSRDSFPRIFGDNWEEAREVFYSHFNKNHLHGLKKLEGAEALLDFLFEHGVRLSVCSNKIGPVLRREVKHLGWTHYFVDIVGAQDAEKDKPDGAPVRLILRGNAMLDCLADEIWLIGDTSSDMQCAQRAGVFSVGLGPRANENPAFMPKLWVEDLAQLLTGFKEGLSSSPVPPRAVNDA